MTASTAALTPLSGLDALFLQLESAEMPMHVGSLSLLELPPGYRGDFTQDLRRLIAARLHLAEAFRRRLVTMPLGLANPAWLRTSDIDLDHHIRRVTLPRPGGLAQLEACVARLHARRLDRSRPLWELVIIDGLRGALSGHLGYYAKVHHAAIDGQAGVALAQAMLDPTPTPRAVPPAPEEARVDEPGTLQRLRVAAAQTTRQLRVLAGLVPAAAEAIGSMLRADGATGAASGAVSGATSGAASAAAGERQERAPLLGPRTPLSVTISDKRAFATASLPLADVKQLAHALDVSLNDIVLATCSGALRRWLARHGGVPRKPIAAGVPFSVRSKGDASASNKVSMMRAGLATHLADPARRLAAIHQSTTRGKAVTGSLRSLLPTDYPSLGSAWVVSGIGWLAGALGRRLPPGTHLPSLAPVAISNVPGPPMTLYVAGARVVHYWPASIVVHGVALNITVQSYADWLDVGLTACRRAVPDLASFRQHLDDAFAELQVLADRVTTAVAAPRAAPPAAARVQVRTRRVQKNKSAAAASSSVKTARLPAARARLAAHGDQAVPEHPTAEDKANGRRRTSATASEHRTASSRSATSASQPARRMATRRR
jgi:WS/DGAT/MGAT family acyltransferase